MFDVHALKVFVSVAQNLSFTRAAESLFLTQSAVSHQIARMERVLGVTLFARIGRRVELTRAGQTLLAQSRRVFTAIDDAAIAVKQADQPDAGSLRIGASATACQFIVPEALREFRECFPRYTLSIVPGDSPAVSEMILDGSIDLGILIKSERQSKLQFHPLFTDEMGLIASPHHPLSQLKKIRTQDLTDQKLVLYSRSSSTWNLLERQFAKLRLPLRDPIELGSIEAIKELVKLGLGIAVLAKWVCERELSEGSLVFMHMPGAKLTRTWCVGAPSGKTLSVAEQTFTSLCKAASKRLSR
jgi:LysR family transcriptional regulator, low CO2-responsive transcriptional regulator